MQKIKIGIIGINAPVFYAKELDILKKSTNWLQSIKHKENFEILNYGLIECKKEADKAREYFDKQNIDFLFIQNSSFSTGDVIYSFAKAEYPIGIWSVEEPETKCDIKLNCLVSSNLYASLIRKNLNDSIKYKWFYGNSNTELFQERFLVTLQAIRGIKALKTQKVALIGNSAPTFDNLKVDIDKYSENICLKNYQQLDFNEIVDISKTISKDEVKSTANELRAESDINISEIHLQTTSLIYCTLKKLAINKNINALAVSCWPDFQEHFGIVPCVAFSMLGDKDKIPVACEGDFGGAVSMLLAYNMSGKIPSIMDFAHLSPENDSFLLWHCGIGSKSLSCSSKPKVVNHPMMNRKASPDKRLGASYDFLFKECEVSICRISDFGSSIFVVSGESRNLSDTGFTGTRGYIKNIKSKDNKVTCLDILNTVMKQGLEHHLIICEGNIESSMIELCYYLDLKHIEINKYTTFA